jgi:hypothetical protein
MLLRICLSGKSVHGVAQRACVPVQMHAAFVTVCDGWTTSLLAFWSCTLLGCASAAVEFEWPTLCGFSLVFVE